MKTKLIVCFFSIAVFAFSARSHAGWELYDDFSSGTIDSEKWALDDSSADISVENERVKFVHQSGYPNDSSWLTVKRNPENITAIKAAVIVESCSGDVRARVAGYAGKMGESHIWSAVQLKESDKRIWSTAGLLAPPDYQWTKSLFYAHYRSPIDVQGNTYVVKMMFENDKNIYEVDGLGKMTYKYATTITPTDNFFRGIGTRSSNGEGPCTVYFDDVYVFKP